MGITFFPKGYLDCGIHMSYSTFGEIRLAIAEMISPEFNEIYLKLLQSSDDNTSSKKIYDQLVSDGILCENFKDLFLTYFMSSDTSGSIKPKTCEFLLNFIIDKAISLQDESEIEYEYDEDGGEYICFDLSVLEPYFQNPNTIIWIDKLLKILSLCVYEKRALIWG